MWWLDHPMIPGRGTAGGDGLNVDFCILLCMELRLSFSNSDWFLV